MRVGLAKKHEGVEARWQAYLRGEEYLVFSSLATSLHNLPPASQLAEHRWEFELLIHLLHRLGVIMGVDHASKAYRSHYSPDVQLTGYLYSTLLTAFTLLPSYVLNGREFYVSDTVLDQCKCLQAVFIETCQSLKRQHDHLQPYALEQIRSDLRRSLIYFDRNWCRFEMPALEEIEAIHRQACRPLIEAIEVERALCECEGGSSSSSSAPRGAPGTHAAVPIAARRVRVEVQRSRMLESICELNRLANIDGHGRDDMDMTCLLEAERLIAKPMCTADCPVVTPLESEPTASGIAAPQGVRRLPNQADAQLGEAKTRLKTVGPTLLCRCSAAGAAGCTPPVLLKVAQTLQRSFKRVRRVLRKYSKCLYQLNSHLANNPDLVHALERFEAAWETANKYFMQAGPRRCALFAYSTVAGIHEPGFQEAVANLDPSVLVASVPRALLFQEMRCAASFVSHVATKLPAATGEKDAIMIDASAMDKCSVQGEEAFRASGVSTCAFQRSSLARVFLHSEAAPAYNEAVVVMGQLPADRLDKLMTSLLLSPTRSRGNTAPATAATSSVLPAAVPPASGGAAGLLSRGGLPATASGSRAAMGSGCGGGLTRAAAELPPPRTPCPPRMAVPNSSRPPTTTVYIKRIGTSDDALPGAAVSRSQGRPATAVHAESPPPIREGDSDDDNEDEDKDEETQQKLSLELSGLQGLLEVAPCSKMTLASALPTSSSGRTTFRRVTDDGGGRTGREHRDVEQQLEGTIGTLAVHLQRSKPQEWNELVQVVLQGIILAQRSAATSGAAAAGPANQAVGRAGNANAAQHHAGAGGAVAMQAPWAPQSPQDAVEVW